MCEIGVWSIVERRVWRATSVVRMEAIHERKGATAGSGAFVDETIVVGMRKERVAT